MDKFKARKTVRGLVPRCQYEKDGKQCERAVYFKGRCFWHQPEAIEQMATIGSKGGKATGKRKARPPEHYAKMVEARQENRCKHGVWAADHCYQCTADSAAVAPKGKK